MAASKRLQTELKRNTPPATPGTTIRLINDKLQEWEVIMDGPADSVFAGGHFKIHLIFPDSFPFKPPSVSFRSKIWHPNVSNDEKGSMCLGILRPETWKPASTVAAILELVRSLLLEPDVDNAVEASIAEQYRTDRPAWEKQARAWVKQYASG